MKAMSLSTLKYFFFFSLFFFILYLEKMSGTGSYAETASDSFAKLWKSALLFIMILYLINKHRLFKIPQHSKSFFLLSFKNLFNSKLMPVNDFPMTFKLINLPILICFFHHFLRRRNAVLFLFVICQFYILSYIPFLLGLIDGYYDKTYGENTQTFVGIFQNPHSAAVTMSICVTFILFSLQHLKGKAFLFNRTYNYLLLTIGIYGLYASYARMGWLMALIGFIIVFFPQKFQLKSIIRYFMLLFIGGIIAMVSIMNSDVLYRRLTDQDIVNGWERESNVGSGRLIYWQTSFEQYMESDFGGKLIGLGYSEIPNNQFKKNGLSILSHNGFLDILVSNGVVGLSLLIAHFIFVFLYIRSYRKTLYYPFLIAVYLSYIAYWIFQGTVYFSFDLLIALSLSLPKI